MLFVLGRGPAPRRPPINANLLAAIAMASMGQRRNRSASAVDTAFRVAEPQTDLPVETMPIAIPSPAEPLAAPIEFIPKDP